MIEPQNQGHSRHAENIHEYYMQLCASTGPGARYEGPNDSGAHMQAQAHITAGGAAGAQQQGFIGGFIIGSVLPLANRTSRQRDTKHE